MQNYNIRNLETQGAVTIKYPSDLRTAVEEAVSSWKSFCDLPQDLKRRLSYSNDSDGFGYESKLGTGPAGDRKENFDVAKRGQDWLMKNMPNIEKLGSIASSFVSSALNLVDVMAPTILDFARRVEDELGIEGFSEDVNASRDSFFVRFIHYPGDRVVGEETCVAHTDQSCFTLHMYESLPGLQGFSLSERKWVDMPVSSGETVIFSAMQFQLRSNGLIKALTHRVIANERSSDPNGPGRYSAVCFIQLKNEKKYNKAVFGRLQEAVVKRGADFTYDMPPEEFEKMFK